MDEVLPEAIKTGYKLIDTAFAYGNQEGIGMTIGKLIEEGKIKVLFPVIVSRFGQGCCGMNFKKFGIGIGTLNKKALI